MPLFRRHLFFICLLFLSPLLPVMPVMVEAQTAPRYQILVDQRATAISIQEASTAQVASRITLPADAMMIQARELPDDPNGRLVALYLMGEDAWLTVYTRSGQQIQSRRVFKKISDRFVQSVKLKSIATRTTGYRMTIAALKYKPSTKQELFIHKIVSLSGENEPLSVVRRAKRIITKPVDRNTAGFTDALALLNYYRTIAGVMPVRIDPQLSQGCEQHVNYMKLNKELTHYETAGKAGFTAEGETAGRSSDLASGVRDMEQAIDLWIHSLYHRLPLLEPSLSSIGVAFSNEGGYACLYVNATEPSMRYVSYAPVAFPASGMTNVPTTFRGNEYPDPLSTVTHQYPVGQVVTLSFPFPSTVERMTVTLTDDRGQQVTGFVRLPRDTQDPNTIVQRNTVSFIPAEPLRPSTQYTALMHGTVDGAPFTKQWSFTTGAQ